MDLTSLDELINIALKKSRTRVAVTAAQDISVLMALAEASKLGMVEPILIGDASKITELAALSGLEKGTFEIFDEPDPDKTCSVGVSLVKEGSAGMLMKGLILTSTFMKSILD